MKFKLFIALIAAGMAFTACSSSKSGNGTMDTSAMDSPKVDSPMVDTTKVPDTTKQQ